MRKLIRSVIRHQAYASHTGHKGFKYLWKQYRIKTGHAVVEGEPVKKKSAWSRAIHNIFGGKRG
jgi:hypothetical protein